MSNAAGRISSGLIMEKFNVTQFSYQNTVLVIPTDQPLKFPECSDMELTAYFLHRVLQMPNPKAMYQFFRSLPKDQNGKIPLARLFILNPSYDRGLLAKATVTPMLLPRRKAIVHHLFAAAAETNSCCKQCSSLTANMPFKHCLLLGEPDRIKYCTNCQYFGSFICSHYIDGEPTTRKARVELAHHRMENIWDIEDFNQLDGANRARALSMIGKKLPVQGEEEAANS